MSEERQECCERCRFWHRLGKGFGDRGTCHRNPPNLGIFQAPARMSFVGYWPETEPDDWCGEFVPLETRAADAFLREQR